MTTFNEMAVACPMCDTVFRTAAIMSCGSGGQDSDFRPQYWGLNPLPLFVHRCPECDFVAYDDEFEHRGREVEGLPEDPGGTGVERYVLAARKAEDANASREEIGHLYLRAAWCARVEQDEDAEQRNMELAGRKIANAVQASEVNDSETATASYLVGELKRRCGDFEEAVNWFTRAASAPMPADDEKKEALQRAINKQSELARANDPRNTDMTEQDA